VQLTQALIPAEHLNPGEIVDEFF